MKTPKEEFEELLGIATENALQLSNKIKKYCELYEECHKQGLITPYILQEKKATMSNNSSDSAQLLAILQKEKYFLGKERKNGIIQFYRKRT